MPNFRLPLTALLVACLFSCGTSPNEALDIETYNLRLVDSVRIDYLGNLLLKDYDPETNQFLAYNEQEKEVLIIAASGDIAHIFTLQSDGPDAINGFGLNPTFSGENILIFSSKIFTLDRDGRVLNRTEIPYPYYWIVGGGHIASFSLANKLLYYKPESAEEGQDPQAAYQGMLKGGPLMEVLDTISGAYYPTMNFPKTEAFREGLFYGYPTPLIQNNGPHWFLSVTNALEFHVYTEKDIRLEFQETVKVPAKNAYLDQPVFLEQMNSFFEENGLVYRIPQIHRFLSLKDHFLTFYSKGVSPEKKATYDVSDPDQRLELVNSFPMEFAVFDSDFNNKAVDLPIPRSMDPFSALVNSKGQIVALKDQENAGVEEDFHTIYQYRLITGGSK